MLDGKVYSLPFFLEVTVSRVKKILLWFAIFLSLFIGLWIAQDNPQIVEVTLLGFPISSLPLGLWLLLMFAVGLAIGLVASVPLVARTSAENRRLKRTVSTT